MVAGGKKRVRSIAKFMPASPKAGFGKDPNKHFCGAFIRWTEGGGRHPRGYPHQVRRKKLAKDERQLDELDRLVIRIYEDNVSGRISDERFAMISKTYENEQAALKREVKTLRREIEVQERQIDHLEQFIQRVQDYTELTELTPYALWELVRAIYTGAPDKSSGKRWQGIHTADNLMGFIALPKLKKEEAA